jgi:hypothetical protein
VPLEIHCVGEEALGAMTWLTPEPLRSVSPFLSAMRVSLLSYILPDLPWSA